MKAEKAATAKKPDPAEKVFDKAVAAGQQLPDSEAIILGSKFGELMYHYVKTVLKRPWPEAEPWIAELDADAIIKYIQCYRGSRWRKVERYILARRDPQEIYSYALMILRTRSQRESRCYCKQTTASGNCLHT